MREPISIRTYPDSRGELYGAKQLIFDCGNGYGLSVITVERGDRWDHGWYCDPGQYEAYLIDTSNPDQWDFVYEDSMPKETRNIAQGVEPFGWLSVEELGQLIELVEKGGKDAYIEKRGLRYIIED